MVKLGRSVVGSLVALALFGSTAYAGETVFTDEGWYRVEGNAPTPAPDQGDATLTTEPALQPTAQPRAATAAAPAPAPGARAQQVPLCLEQRGKLVRRLLALHGADVDTVSVRDRELGGLGAVGWGAPLPFSASLSLDPDLNLLSGNAPIPPSAVNWDSEARWDWASLVDCQSAL